MAEVKNTFIQSKMNQDLDGRIIPNGQYRTALNVGISRSEGDDVGALENVLGNVLITDFGLDDCSLKCIGHWMDVANDRIFVFITNYSDSSATLLNNNPAGGASVGTDCYIAYYDIRANKGTIIVGGDWLNFSKTHPIHGVNLIENLLFWTDNRNQPRKINVNTAIANPYVINSTLGYYFNEDQISVAKYYPFEPIMLLDGVGSVDNVYSTMKNVTEEWLPIHCILRVTQTDPISTGKTYITVDGTHTYGSDEENLFGSFTGGEGDRISGVNIESAGGFDYVQLQSVSSLIPGETIIGLKNQITTQQLYENQNLYVQRKNPYYNPLFSGDPDFLKDKFARFSYRFKFDDGEYSLIAPFTQIAFVPLQDGYFIGDNCDESTGEIPLNSTNTGPGQESEAYRSTIVPFMENKVDEIILRLPAPTPYNTSTTPLNWDEVIDNLKITEIDILWKSADDQSIKVIETLKSEFFSNETTNLLDYTYNSTEPWRTLPTNELTRVSDKVPIRALSQEATGNRIIYGNFVDRHTSPGALEYAVNIDEKPPLPIYPEPIDYTNANFVRKEYQNHTLKQNRTYQVGVILSDRYGRQSDVILSNIEAVGGGKASTIYHPYRDINAYLITDQDYLTNPSTTWPGDMLELSWTNTIPSTSTKPGYPGLFSVNDGSVIGVKDVVSSGWGSTCGTWKVAFGDQFVPAGGTPANGGSMEFTSNADGTIDESTIVIRPGSYGFNNGQTVSVYDGGIIWPGCGTSFGTASFGVITPSNNNLGWYSYKIVVKQTEQEYYNCYLPGMLAGYPQDIIGSFPVVSDAVPYNVTQQGVKGVHYPTGLQRKEAHIVLTNDNINKIPRDLIEVGPDQQQFRSAVKLFGRIENVKVDMSGSGYDTSNMNKQYQPNALGDTVTVIGPMTELGLGSLTNPEGNIHNKFYAGPSDNLMDLLIPPHWYDGQSNPLIARVSTKDEIGWRMVPQNSDEDYAKTMTPFLSVYETAPVESKLDIYWETTTSGLISELNHLIQTEDSKIPVGISDPQLFIPEDTESGTQVGATFWAEAAGGVDLDSPGDGCTITLVNVTYSNPITTSIAHKFELIKNQSGFNQYYLQTKTNEFLLSYEDSGKCNLIFEFNINRNNGVDPISNTTVIATGIVTNVSPGERNSYNGTRERIKSLAKDSNIPITCANLAGTGCETLWGLTVPWTTQPYYSLDHMYCSPVGGYNTSINWTDSSSIWIAGVPNTANRPPGNSDPYRCEFSRSKRGQGKLYGLRGSIPYQAPANAPYFDGVFKADNGIYGSQPGTLPSNYNGSNQTEDELQFYVARAYQVSAIYGFNENGFGGDQRPPGWGRGCPQLGYTNVEDGLCFPGTPAVEWVFGRPNIAETQDPTANNYPTPKIWAPGLSWNNADVRTFVPGPTYIEHPNQVGMDPTNTTGPSFGEAVVGGQHNSGNNYWQDLDLQMKYAASGLWDAGGITYDMETLQLPKTGHSGPWRLLKKENTTELYLAQLGGSANWLGNGGIHSDDFPRFVGKNVGANNSVQEGEIWVGRGVHGVDGWAGMTNGEISSIMSGWTGMPPGRYVVTLRAQDKNGNPDGLFFEWDVPVIILETNDPGSYLNHFKGKMSNAGIFTNNSKNFECCNCEPNVTQYTSNGGPCNP